MLLNFLLQTPGGSNPIMGFLPIILIFGIFYFLLFLPMQRQKKQQQKMLRELQAGDQVVTSGGIVGYIVKLDENSVILRVKPDNLKLEVSRSAVSAKVAVETEKK